MNRIINSSLSKAIYNDDLDEVRYLLKIGTKCNLQDNTGWTPLHSAVQKNRLDMVELILAQPDAPINKRCFEGESPLFLACSKKCSYRIISSLLISGADPNLANNEDITPLHIVTDPKITELLLTFGANVNSQDFNNYTPLHSAIEKNEYKIVDLLIKAGADTSLRELNGLTPLMLSFQYNYRGVEELLKATEDINAVAKDGWSALMLAINAGKIDIAFKLIEMGANVNIVAESFTPLHLAVLKQEEQLFKVLWSKTNYKMYKNMQDLPHLMLIHRWYIEERLGYFYDVLETRDIFLNEKNQQKFLEFLFRFERDNKLELVICDIVSKVCKTLAPFPINPQSLISFIENFSNYQYKFKLMDILIQSGVATFDSKVFAVVALILDPEIIPKLLTLTVSINPSQIFTLFTREARMDMQMLNLLMYLLKFCTPKKHDAQVCLQRLKRFNPYSAKRVKYTLNGINPVSNVQMYRTIDYEITPEDRELMCDIYSKVENILVNKKVPPSLKELTRDVVRKEIYMTKKYIKNCDISLKNYGLPKDIIDIIFLKKCVNNIY